MILQDWQAQYGALLVGRGTPYDVDWTKTGLLDLPSMRTSDTERARGDGSWSGEEYASAQMVSLSLQMFGRARIDLGTVVRTLEERTTPRVGRDLWFKVPHFAQPRCLRGARVRRRAIPLTRGFEQVVRAELDLYAADPARYGPETTLTALAGSRPSVAGVNEGTLDAWPVFVVYGPSPAEPVTIEHDQTGSLISITTALAAGQQLVIDPRVGTAVVDGVSDRGSSLTDRQWWAIPPLSPFSATMSGPEGLRVDVRWRAAWW